MNIPNLITWSRILLIPFFFMFFYLPFLWSRLLAVAIFALAAFTDWLDGYLARSLKQETRIGAFLDPVADKLLVVIALLMIVGSSGSILVAIPAAIIVAREIIISALREWMADLGKRSKVNVSIIGKVKTTIQMISLLLLLLSRPGSWEYVGYAGIVLLYVAAALTLWSMTIYLRVAWPDLNALEA